MRPTDVFASTSLVEGSISEALAQRGQLTGLIPFYGGDKILIRRAISCWRKSCTRMLLNEVADYGD
jgi:hypothetical protein